MDETCQCGHTLAHHALYLGCDLDDCGCSRWLPAAPWYREVVGICLCELPVRRNEPRRGVVFQDRNVICHLDCAPS